MHMSLTANGAAVLPSLDPSSVPEAVAIYVAVAEALMERAAVGLSTRLVISAPAVKMDTFVPAAAVIQMATDSEIVAEDSPHFRDVLVERLRTRYVQDAEATGQIHLDVDSFGGRIV